MMSSFHNRANMCSCSCTTRSSSSESLYWTILKDVMDYCPRNHNAQGVSQHRIVLLGQTGSGKTSFFNSLNSSVHGFVTNQAVLNGGGLGTNNLGSNLFQEYDVISPSTGNPLGWSITDTKGFQRDSDLSDLLSVVDGNTHLNWQFGGYGGSFSSKSYTADRHQMAHCCALVIDAPRVNSLTSQMWEKFDILQRAISARGIPVVILLTQIDKILSSHHGSPRDVFYNEPIRDIVRTISIRLRHIPVNRIFPIKNYDSEFLIDVDTSILILLAFREILRLCDKHLSGGLYFLPKVPNWKDKAKEYIPKNGKIWLLGLVAIVILLCIVFVRPTLVWRKTVAAVLVSLGETCFMAGWAHTQHCHDLFGDDDQAHDEEHDYYV